MLRTAFGARLQPAGWEVSEAEDEGHRLVACRYPLHEEFAATGEVWVASSVPDRPPVRVTHVFVGVSYDPLRRLSPLLGLYEVEVLHQDVWPDVSDEEDDDENGEEPLEVKTADDAERAAERLAPLIIERAVPFAERYASVEALLAEFSDGPSMSYAAVLAAAGRFDEARAALAQLQVSERYALTRRTRRAARQLKRWVEGGGDPSLIPDSAPPSQFSTRTFTSFSELWAQSRSESRAQSAALKQAREAARGKSREEARAVLREALARHGAKASPLWIESRLDHLWDSPEDRVQLGIKMLRGAARFGLGAAKAIRDHELPDLSKPDWLEPPDHALYEVPRSDEWIAAELDRGAGQWVDRVYQAAPHPLGIVTLTAWLRRPSEGADAGDVLDIYIGEQRVGNVSAEDAVAYAGVMTDAAARDEHPCVDAHLARRGGEYLLELAKPGTG